MYCIILVVAKDKKEAAKIAAALVKNKLAACVNIIAGVSSVFRWQGRVEQAREALLVIKSKKAKFPAIARMTRSLHSYDVPEMIAIPIISGFKPYLDWINESVG
ncbi:MAG: divalent-cation tolerance protein CutA [Candidatus Omnitrophota bacterium]